MTTIPTSKHAVTFVFITVFLDMVGFGLIMPVLPRLIENVGQVTIADAAAIGGWATYRTPSGDGPCCCWRCLAC
jgi:hypothetical protein